MKRGAVDQIMKRSVLSLTAVVIGYIALLAVIFLYVPSPWNWVAAVAVLAKGWLFVTLLRRASSLGNRGTPPPPRPR